MLKVTCKDKAEYMRKLMFLGCTSCTKVVLEAMGL